MAETLSIDRELTGAITGPTQEGDALRLRQALHQLRLNLQVTDGEVIELLEDWQDAADRCEKAEKKAAKLRTEADEQEIKAEWHRQRAAFLFQVVSSKLASTAHGVHLATAPFVQTGNQQALQLQCWLLQGRRWRPVRIKVADGQLVYTRLSRSMFTRRRTLTQVALALTWIDGTRADGDVLINTGPCSVEARWQWTCVLGASGRERLKVNELVFCCESESAMHFWACEVHNARAHTAAGAYGEAVHELPLSPERISMAPSPMRYLPPPAYPSHGLDLHGDTSYAYGRSLAPGGLAMLMPPDDELVTPRGRVESSLAPASGMLRFSSWRKGHNTNRRDADARAVPEPPAAMSSAWAPPPDVPLSPYGVGYGHGGMAAEGVAPPSPMMKPLPTPAASVNTSLPMPPPPPPVFAPPADRSLPISLAEQQLPAAAKRPLASLPPIGALSPLSSLEVHSEAAAAAANAAACGGAVTQTPPTLHGSASLALSREANPDVPVAPTPISFSARGMPLPPSRMTALPPRPRPGGMTTPPPPIGAPRPGSGLRPRPSPAPGGRPVALTSGRPTTSAMLAAHRPPTPGMSPGSMPLRSASGIVSTRAATLEGQAAAGFGQPSPLRGPGSTAARRTPGLASARLPARPGGQPLLPPTPEHVAQTQMSPDQPLRSHAADVGTPVSRV